ncbi:MAG: flagellar motor switch protein FliG [Deltaproteobacteria bacterium RBG_13_58_19]|nr:MAG: flagellar motor switch protein FliG [Deltaproteobacteria bacterium RBG_13_58_19]
MAIKVEKLTGADKAAMLILSLGENYAGEILKRLEDREVQLLGQKISKLEVVQTKQMANILEEFSKMMEAPEAIVVRGTQFFKNTISRAMDVKRTEDLMEKLNLEQSPEFFQKIKKLDSRTVASFLRNEHPQTVALVLAHLDRGQAGAVLAQFPENLQMEVVRRIAGLDQVSPLIIEEIDLALKEEISLVEEVGGRAVGGCQSVAEILNQMERTSETAILKRLEEEDQEDLAEEIRRFLFTFEDLLGVEDRGMMAILKEVNTQDLAMALKAASEELKGKFYKNMSTRAAEMLQEELEIMGPARLRDVEAAQQKVIQIAKRLEGEGQLVLTGKGSEEIFV